MTKSKLFNVKRVALATAVLLGATVAAPAFAGGHGHVSVGIGVNLPGVSIGYSNGYRGGYYPAPYYGPAYYPAPVYYRPAPRVVYYDDPVVVERPVVVRHVYEERRYEGDGDHHRHYYRDYED